MLGRGAWHAWEVVRACQGSGLNSMGNLHAFHVFLPQQIEGLKLF